MESRDRKELDTFLTALRFRNASLKKRRAPKIASNNVSLQYDLLYGDISRDGSLTDSGLNARSLSRGRSRKRHWTNDEEGLDRVA